MLEYLLLMCEGEIYMEDRQVGRKEGRKAGRKAGRQAGRQAGRYRYECKNADMEREGELPGYIEISRIRILFHILLFYSPFSSFCPIIAFAALFTPSTC
jgi:hypothetical protein